MVTVDSVTHTWRGDMQTYLLYGTNFITLWLNQGGSAANLAALTFDDGAATAYDGATAGGTFTPLNPLSQFESLDSSALWGLEIWDTVSGDSGTLDGWTLTLCGRTVMMGVAA